MIATGPASGTISHMPQLCIAQDDAADELRSRGPLVLMVEMLLDQHSA